MPILPGTSPWDRSTFPHPGFWGLFSFSFAPWAGSHPHPLLLSLLLPEPSVFSPLGCRIMMMLLLTVTFQVLGLLWGKKKFWGLQGKGISRVFQGFSKISPACSSVMGMLIPPLSFPSSCGEVQLPTTSQASQGNNTARLPSNSEFYLFLGEKNKKSILSHRATLVEQEAS